MTHFEKIKEGLIKTFEKEFILRPFESDGDFSFKYGKLTPYNLKEFLSNYADKIKSAVLKDIEEEINAQSYE